MSQFGVLGSVQRRNIRLERLVAGVVALFCISILTLGAFLVPSSTGVGTHTELPGLRPCVWMEVADLPCPTCGMTTAFAHAANADLLKSFLTQPMGCLLAMAVAIAFWIALYVVFTGSPIGRFTLKLWRPVVIWSLAGFTLVAWAYKIWIVRGGV